MPDGFLPPALLNEPELWAENSEFLLAFNRLSATRQNGINGDLRISIAEMNAYLHMFEIEDAAEFFNAITACDQVFFDHIKKVKPTESGP